jgi:tRNA threonylcarbamoyl adenosine modification protein YeaZ
LVLVLDTSSARTGIAVLEGGEPRGELVVESGRTLRLPELVGGLVDVHRLSAVAVATGPGSFTGLRAGASYAVGLALGLGLELLGLPTLELAAARAYESARGLAEAGRGRVYHQAPGGEPGLAEPEELPRDLPAAGWLRHATAESVRAAGVRLLTEGELRPFGEAAASLLGRAEKLGYDTVRLRYMQSFGPLR